MKLLASIVKHDSGFVLNAKLTLVVKYGALKWL